MIPLASILLLGIGAQWLAWRLRLPSILVLLLVGFAAGPFTGLLDPDELLGDALLPFVTLSVGAVLLEGGLSLRLRDLRGSGGAVRNLILFGVPITFALSAAAARLTLGVELGTALLLGAILVVTGPTVIVPLLRHVRPAEAVGSVVRWEGIVTDPIGAILAVLVFQGLVSLEDGFDAGAVLGGLARAVGVGGAFGLLGAALFVGLQTRHLIPDFLESSAVLATGLGVFVASDFFQHESGLLAVTLMGILLANQKWATVAHVVEFKENLRVLLISTLFILLAARLPLEEFTELDPRSLVFVAVLILVVRPASVLLSTLGTSFGWRERLFVAWMAPRGIVAAAVASVFTLDLAEAGHPDADRVVSTIFVVIVVTVAVYGSTAGFVARRLGLSKGRPQGVLILGAHPWARDIAKALKDAGQRVLLVDRNYHDVRAARIEGLDAHFGNILSEDFETHAPLHEMGFLVCLTANDEVNSLACMHFSPWFERARLFQVAPERAVPGEGEGSIPAHLRGRVLFDEELDFWRIQARFRQGWVLKRTRLGEEFGYGDFREMYDAEGAPAVPFFLLGEDGRLSIVAAGAEIEPGSGDSLIALVRPPEEEARGAADRSQGLESPIRALPQESGGPPRGET